MHIYFIGNVVYGLAARGSALKGQLRFSRDILQIYVIDHDRFTSILKGTHSKQSLFISEIIHDKVVVPVLTENTLRRISATCS